MSGCRGPDEGGLRVPSEDEGRGSKVGKNPT